MLPAGGTAATPLLQTPGEYRALRGPYQTFLLAPEAEDARARSRVLMMGELVSRMTVVEIINLVTSTGWSGELHLASAEGPRVLTIAQGALKHARTEVERERIGELLVRSGALERAQLQSLLPQKTSDERFGQLLVRQGLLDQEQLFKALQQQTEAIFYAAMLVEDGSYWFVAPPENAPAPPTTLHLPIQGLLMEGVQRIDEMAVYRERIPDNRFFPAAVPESRRDGLEPNELAVLALCDGTRSIDDVTRAAGFGEFLTIKAIFNMLRGGQLQLRRGPSLDRSAARRLVRKFNEVMRDISVVVATYGPLERARQALTSWLANSPHRRAVGDELDIDGTLDAARVVARLEALASDDPLHELHQALHELAAYALFVASNGLPRHEERALARDVNHRLQQLRL